MRTRIDVYTDDETKRLIRLAAAKFDMAVTDFCLDAILEKLEQVRILDAEKIEIEASKAVKQKEIDKLFTDLHALRQEIAERNNGASFDIAADLAALREEREREILGLC